MYSRISEFISKKPTEQNHMKIGEQFIHIHSLKSSKHYFTLVVHTIKFAVCQQLTKCGKLTDYFFSWVRYGVFVQRIWYITYYLMVGGDESYIANKPYFIPPSSLCIILQSWNNDDKKCNENAYVCIVHDTACHITSHISYPHVIFAITQ